MTVGERLNFLIEYLKSKKLVESDKDFGIKIDENSNGVSDLKKLRKKITMDHLQLVKKHWPSVNIDWLVTGEGDIEEDYKDKYEKALKENSELQEKFDSEKRNLTIAHKFINELEEKAKKAGLTL
jgi:Cu/Ag efflux protein CusF